MLNFFFHGSQKYLIPVALMGGLKGEASKITLTFNRGVVFKID